MASIYDTDMPERAANYRALTPLSFLNRAAEVFPDRVAMRYDNLSFSWKQYAERCHRLAAVLIALNIQRGDTVSIMAANTPAMLEAQFGIPMSGAVVNSINIRLDAATVAFQLEHSETKIFLVDPQFAETARQACASLKTSIQIIDVPDHQFPETKPVGKLNYETLLAQADLSLGVRWPESEWDAIALNYTSGTTGSPKGVVYHHRGAYLNALGQTVNFNMTTNQPPTYLWTLPLFHCNGWCFAWALAVVAGTSVCLRKLTSQDIYHAIDTAGVTHFCSAPTVLAILLEQEGQRASLPRPIFVMTAGAAPPPPILVRMNAMGFSTLHVYGMTEMHGVTTLCEWQDDWADRSPEQQVALQVRQGVRSAVMEGMVVADPESLEPVTADGQTVGEIMFQGNLGMKGYLKNPQATEQAFAGGWYRSGDLAVRHPDGYVEIKDRSKDIIISGGENISSIELEGVLMAHPLIDEVAVVAVPDEKWGEAPCAIVQLCTGTSLTEGDVIAHCRANLATFKCPRHVIFEPIVRTATGKVQKFVLRDHAAQVIAQRANQ